MIYLNPENASALGDDTFWTWFKREFPSSRFGLPKRLKQDDVVIQYSTLGFPMAGRSIALLLELYPEMRRVFRSNEWDDRLKKVYEAAQFCTFRVVPTYDNVQWYEQFGTVDVIPIGVNTNLFKPASQKLKEELRERYRIPPDARVGFWCGTVHPMKGYDLLKEYSATQPDIYWIIVWKWHHEATLFDGNGTNFISVKQDVLSDLMRCADFCLSTGRLKPYFMVEWEAMASDLPIVTLTDREFVPSPLYPRQTVFDMGWSREDVRLYWTTYLLERGVSW